MNNPSSNERLDQILAVYLESERSGLTLDRQRLLADHSDLADELRAFFADHDRMKAMADASDQKPGILKMPGFLPAEDATLMPQRPSDARDDESNVLQPGSIIRYFGDYELLSEIARGGMGVVYKARQVKLNRIVAIKMILAGQLASQEDVRRFSAKQKRLPIWIIRGSCRSSKSVSTTASISSRWAMSKARALPQRFPKARSNRVRPQGCS